MRRVAGPAPRALTVKHGEAYRRRCPADSPRRRLSAVHRANPDSPDNRTPAYVHMSTASTTDFVSRRLPAGWRWLGIGMRAVHLAAVVLLGAAVLGAAPRLPFAVTGVALLASGLVLLALETWKAPGVLMELAGAGMLAKLAFIVWMVVDVPHAELAFWLVTLWSVVFAHAPASFRHRRIDALWRRRS